jgi:hypothetical protein
VRGDWDRRTSSSKASGIRDTLSLSRGGPRVSRRYDPAVADNVEQVGEGQSRAASSGVAFDYQRGPHPSCDLPVNPRIERAFEDRGRMPIHNNCREGACDFFLVYCAAEPVPAKP